MPLFDTITDAENPYDANVTIHENELTVTNRQNGKTITVFAETYYDKDGAVRLSEYIVEFSTQHRHFEEDEEEEIIDYILSIMRDEVLPIEFFCNDQRRSSTISSALCVMKFCRSNFSATISDALAVSLTAKRIPASILQNGWLISAMTRRNMLLLHMKSTAGRDALTPANKI